MLITHGFLLPDWVLGWMLLVALGSFLLGLPPRVIFGLSAIPLYRLLVILLLRPWLEIEPIWVAALIYVTVGLVSLQSILIVIFGREAAGNFTGTMLVRLFDTVIRGPFRGALKMMQALLRS